MADPRTFTLIGEFKDGITPELEKINKQLAALKANFSGIGSRKNTGFRGATNDIGKLVSAHKKLSESIKGVEGDLKSTVGVLQQYRREMGKAASATRAFQKAGGKLGGDQFTKEMSSANKAAQEYLRTIRQINEESRRAYRGGRGGGFQPPRPPRGDVGGGYQPPRTPRGGMGGGGGYGDGMRPPAPPSGGGGGMGAHMAEFGFAYTLGNAISQPIQNAIVAGFQIGVGLMTKPFEYFADKLKERIEDEQSDIKAAGGIFSIARRQKDPFVKTMDEAMEFTQANNKYLAELAAALPGNTQQYIEVSKRISDSISRIVMADPTKAIEYSNKLRAEEGKQALTGSTQAQTKGAITQLLGEMTKKTVLAGLGTGGGPGGVAGAYGLPQLTERMLTQQEVSMGQFQRYAAIFKDPLIMDALNRFIPKINASAAGTMERFEVMAKFYDEVLPKEMIRKFERSTAGVLELFNTTIFGPETGLFGLGRKMEGMGKVMDDYGNYVKVFEDGTRKAGVSFAEATDANLSLFDLLRDSFANLGIALYPILSNLSAIFDPINKVSKLLVDFRHSTGKFLRSFEAYKKGFEEMLKGMDDASKKEFLKIGLDLRASLAAVNNFFANAGIIDESQFQKNAKQLMSTSFDSKAMMSGMLDTFLNSDVAGQFGAMIGEIIGTVLSEVANVTGFVSGRIAKSNKLFEGIKAGFEKAGGPKALSNIFRDVLKSMLKALLSLGKLIPLEGYFIAGAALVMPAVAQGLGMKIGEEAWGLVAKLGDLFKMRTGPALQKMKDAVRMFFDDLITAIRSMFSSKFAIQEVTVRDLGSNAPKALPPGGAPKAFPSAGALATSAVTRGMSAFAKFMGYVKEIGPRFLGFFKEIGGKLTILGGILTTVVSLFQGKNLAESLAQGAGPVLGAALGAALIPFFGPIGPLIGSLIGGWVGSMKMVTDPLTEIFTSLGGSLTGLKDSVGMILTLTGDLLGEIVQLIAGFAGVEGEVDSIKIALAPITLALQAFEVGLKGFALLLAEIRVFFKRYFGSSKEYKEAIAERDKLNASMRESQGRINAYNDSMLGTARLQKGVNDAQYLLINGGKKLNDARKKELVAYIESAKKLDKEIKIKKNVVVTATVKPSTVKPAPAAAAKQKSDKIRDDLRSRAGADIGAFWKALTNPPEPPKKPTKAPVGERLDKDLAKLLNGKPSGGKPPAAKEITQTAQNTNNLNKKATDQIKETTSVKSGVDKTTQAVNSLAAKITPQTNLQTTTAAIYNLLASGQLRVQGSVAPGSFSGPYDPYKNPLGNLPFDPKQKDPNKPSNIFTWAKGGLGDAIRSEIQNKPAGSDLVIANSSETVIPAAGGNEGAGMVAFVDTLRAGFNAVVTTFRQTSQQAQTHLTSQVTTLGVTFKTAQEKQRAEIAKITQTLISNQMQTNAKLAALETKFNSPAMPGGLGGGAAGGVDAFTPIAQRMGLTMTSGYRPGDPGWHGANRARDFSNGTGPTPQMMQFAQYMASTYGSNLKELIYTPLGFSIKNGQRVAPYAQGSHYNHVHVAYALGPENGVGFTKLKGPDGAQSWEKSMVPGSVKVASITGNSAEGFGSNTFGDINVTVNAGSTTDPDALASIVALKIGEAVADARAASIFV